MKPKVWLVAGMYTTREDVVECVTRALHGMGYRYQEKEFLDKIANKRIGLHEVMQIAKRYVDFE